MIGTFLWFCSCRFLLFSSVTVSSDRHLRCSGNNSNMHLETFYTMLCGSVHIWFQTKLLPLYPLTPYLHFHLSVVLQFALNSYQSFFPALFVCKSSCHRMLEEDHEMLPASCLHCHSLPLKAFWTTAPFVASLAFCSRHEQTKNAAWKRHEEQHSVSQ